MDNKLLVSIVIPNWNGCHLLKKYLHKIQFASPGTEIILSDDASTDNSLEYVRENFPNILVVANSCHRGFASTVNAGVKRAKGDVVVLLNTDVEPEKGFITPLLVHFKDGSVFGVGCLEKSHEKGKIVLRGRGLAHWVKGFFIHKRGEEFGLNTAWISGGSGAYRKSMWDALGGMDALYDPFYWEDIDLSYRARKAGWDVVFEPKSVVHHYHEEGKIKKEFDAKEVIKISYRNQFIFIWKNVTDVSMLLDHELWTPFRIIQTLMHGDILMLQGYILAIMKLPAILRYKIRFRTLNKISDSELGIWE